MKPPHETPSAAEFGQLRALLARRGMSQAEISQAIGNRPNGRSRQQITDELKIYLRNRS